MPQVHLTWTNNATTQIGFHISRQVDDGVWDDGYATAGSTSESFVDMNVVYDTKYCYRVSAQNLTGLSAWTAVVCATPRLTEVSPVVMQLLNMSR